MTNIIKNKTIQNTFLLMSSKGFTTIFGVASSILYGIIFSKYNISIITLFELFVSFFVSTVFEWSSIGIIRFGKIEYETTGNINKTSAIRIHIFGSLLVFSSILLFFFKSYVSNYIGIDNNSIIIYIFFTTLLFIIHDHFTHIFMTIEKHYINVIHDIGVSLIKIAILSLFYFKVFEIDTMLYFLLNIIGLVILLIPRLFLIKKNYIFPIFIKIKKEEYLQYIKYVSPQFLGFIGLYLINSIDTIVIKAYCSMENLGAYKYMYSLFMKIAAVSYILPMVFLPRIISWQNKNKKTILKYLKYIPVIVFFSMTLLSIFLLLVYPYVFNYIYGNKFTVAYSSFSLLIIVLPLYFTTYTIIPVINAFDKIFYLQLINICSAAFNVILDLLLIPKIGILGGAIGTLVSITFKLLCVIIIVLIIKKNYFKQAIA